MQFKRIQILANADSSVRTSANFSSLPQTQPEPEAQPALKKYVLVLDLDETLVHYKDSSYFTPPPYSNKNKQPEDPKLKVRPGV